MKKIITLLIISLFSISLASAAGKKTVDDWKKEIEDQLGPISWGKAATLQSAFKNAKEFKGQEAYYINTLYDELYDLNFKIIITNPDKRDVAHTSLFFDNSPEYTIATKSFSELNKNDIFITFGNLDSGTAYLWQMQSQKVMKKALIKNPNGGYGCKSDYASIVMKYADWSQGGAKATKDAGSFQGKTKDYINTSYETVYSSSSSCFSILISNYKDLSLTEIKLGLLGRSNKIAASLIEAIEKEAAEKEAAEKEIQKANLANSLKSIEEDKPALGLIVMSDGSFRNPYRCNENNDIFPVGVICKVNSDGKTGLMVGIHNSGDRGYRWAGKTEPEDENGYDWRRIEYPVIDCGKDSDSDLDGSANWKYICSIDPEGSQDPEKYYPAFAYVLNYAQSNNLAGTIYENDWYMPSYYESKYYLAKNYELLKLSSSAAIGESFCSDENNVIWTSDTIGDVFAINCFLDLDGVRSVAPYRYFEESVCVLRKF